jgi:hypothetical protein
VESQLSVTVNEDLSGVLHELPANVLDFWGHSG